MKKKILLLLTRLPDENMTGRKSVIKTIFQCLEHLNYEYDIILFGEDQKAKKNERNIILNLRRFKWLDFFLKLPSYIKKEISISELLYYRESSRVLLKQIDTSNYSFLVCDTIRLAPFAHDIGIPWHLDLDDLLSERYSQLSKINIKISSLLGYWNLQLPTILDNLFSLPLKRLLAFESRVIKDREKYWSSKANSCSLVSPKEAAHFSNQIKRTVFSLPMGFDMDKPTWKPKSTRPKCGVFVGSLHYHPNLEAIEKLSIIYQNIPKNHAIDLQIYHIGNSSRIDTAHINNIHFLGYVDDLRLKINDFDFFVSFITSGTGIKTKIIEAMFYGIPLLVNKKSIEGLNLQHLSSCYLFSNHHEMQKGISFLSDPQNASRLSHNAFIYAYENFHIKSIAKEWLKILEPFMNTHTKNVEET